MSDSEETPANEGGRAPSGKLHPDEEHTDGRKRWDWESHYPTCVRRKMLLEAIYLSGVLLVLSLIAGFLLTAAAQRTSHTIFVAGQSLTVTIDYGFVALYFIGSVGAVMYSMKWLIHSVAVGTWHLDRRYWRFLVPWMGGIYALAVLGLFEAGFAAHASQPTNLERPAIASARDGIATFAVAFLIGYFSDRVGGLLSNIANSLFGRVKK